MNDEHPNAEREGPVVTLDGPAGSGKSTTAREVARRLGFRHLDSGALYRALTYALLERGAEPEAWPELGEGDLRDLDVRLEPGATRYRVFLGADPIPDDALRTDLVTGHVSRLARIPAARGALLDLQRAAGRHGRLVADGRDMGTVVFPDADLKVYLVADLAERARRRLLERTGSEDPDEVAREAETIGARDRHDSEREVSPLARADDAWELDTTGLSFEEQVDAVVRRVRELTIP